MAAELAEYLTRWTALEPATAGLVARLLVVALAATLLLLAYRLLLAALGRLLRARPAHETARRRTLVSLLTSLARWSLGFVAVVIVLRELGVDVMPVLVSAGVLGLAIGFGAQSLVRDVITGFFLLFEGLIRVGDIVQIGPTTGTVETIGLRITTVRMDDGALRIVPNGQITEFANFSAGGVRATVDVPVARDVPIEVALSVLEEVGETWARETARALDRPRAQGIMAFSGGGDAVLRLTVRVAPEQRVEVETELRRRIKLAFDRRHWAPIGAAG
jgi:small-conductance mechanosensitive channel